MECKHANQEAEEEGEEASLPPTQLQEKGVSVDRRKPSTGFVKEIKTTMGFVFSLHDSKQLFSLPYSQLSK